MRVLITRPEPDAVAFAELCRARGLTPILAPLMRIRIHDAPLDLNAIGALAFTSANGVRAFAANDPARSLKVFAIGKATAAEAYAQGFKDIAVAGGDVDALAQCIAYHQGQLTGEVLHIAGADRAGDLVAALDVVDIPSRREVLYKAEAATALPQVATAALASASPSASASASASASLAPVDWAAFFSPRTARLFVSLVRDAGLEAQLGVVRAACLSDAVAQALAGAKWLSVDVSLKRTASDMADLIARTKASGER